MDSTKHIGMDVHKESISIAVLNSCGKLVIANVSSKPRIAFSTSRRTYNEEYESSLYCPTDCSDHRATFIGEAIATAKRQASAF
jgi:hypothetical protein